MQHLSPAKDEGWKNDGTEQQVQTRLNQPQQAQSKLGHPCLTGWGCRQGARAREFQQRKGRERWATAQGGNCNVERGWSESVGRGAGLGLQQSSLARVEEVGGGPGPRAGSICGARHV